MKEYEIYQLKNIDETADIRFMNYDGLIHRNRQIDLSNYDKVYQGEMTSDMDLESIYVKFNVDRPDDFYGHSLSVSDIVVVRENGSEWAYYVDSVGFKEVPIAAETKQRADVERDDRYPPLYRHTFAYAREAGQIDECRLSRIENIHCANAIDRAIAENYDGMHLNAACVRPLIEQFGGERMSWVLANTLLMKDYDGRFSRSNKEWGAKMEVPLDRDNFGSVRNTEFELRSHPGLLNMFIFLTKRELEADRQREKALEKEERSSVRGALRDKQAIISEKKQTTDREPQKDGTVLE